MPLPKPLKRLIGPVVYPMQRKLTRLWQNYQAGEAVRRVTAPPHQAGAAPAVSYAHAGFPGALPGPGDFVHGGAVKYTYLHRLFPHSGLNFNVLYAVSSSYVSYLDRLVAQARRQGAKVVWNQNGVYHPQSYANAAALNAWVAVPYRQADYIFYQSKFCWQSAITYLGDHPRGEILYNAIDTAFFTPRTDPFPEGELRLLMAGTHYSDYRLPAGIRTLALVRQHRPARLIISGKISGAFEEEAHRLIAELKLADYVDFLGAYAQKDAPDIYRQGQIYLHTKYLDPCPSAVIEAMACGLPVVYSHSGGTPELVGETAGASVPAPLSWERDIPPDPEMMAECILRIANDLPQVSAAARQRAVDQFDLQPWLVRHRQVFHMLLEERP